MILARILVLAASALTLTAAYADSSGAVDKTAVFMSLDIDGDGLVSKAEAAGNAEVTQAFDRADRDRDGKLSVAEYERYNRLRAKAEARKKKRALARKAERSASTGATSPPASGR